MNGEICSWCGHLPIYFGEGESVVTNHLGVVNRHKVHYLACLTCRRNFAGKGLSFSLLKVSLGFDDFHKKVPWYA